MKYFVSRRTYDDKVLELQSENVYVRNLNQTLQERISHGEDYRHYLQREIDSLREANRRMVAELDSKTEELAAANHKLGDLRLQLMSLEARWNKPAPEQIPHLPPLARDDRRREADA